MPIVPNVDNTGDLWKAYEFYAGQIAPSIEAGQWIPGDERASRIRARLTWQPLSYCSMRGIEVNAKHIRGSNAWTVASWAGQQGVLS